MSSGFRKSPSSSAAVAVVVGAAMALGGCVGTGTRSGDRAAALGTGGAAIGAAIGSEHGTGGAFAGALIGGATGLMIAGILDEIEREQMRSAQLAAARSGRSSRRAFHNSKGQRVVASARTTRTWQSGGVRYRELTTSISRDGGTPSTSSATYKEVKSGQWQPD